MKVLLVDTPSNIRDKADPARAYVPLGPLYLASVLERHGYETEVYDPRLSGQLTPRNGHFYFGDDLATIQARVRQAKPDVVGISALFTRDKDNAEEIARVVKQVDPAITVMAGGGHVNGDPTDLLQTTPEIDYAAAGEGEIAIVEMMEMLEGKKKPESIKGLVYRDSEGQVRFNGYSMVPELDDLPLPAYDKVPMERYFDLQKKGFAARPFGESDRCVSMITSRGCPFKCNFCSVFLTNGRRWRAHSPEYVMRHLDVLVTKFGTAFVQFEDDALTTSRKRFEEILDAIIAQYGDSIGWGTPNGVRADSICDPDVLRKAKRAGCAYLNIAVESGDQQVLNDIVHKRLDLKYVDKLAKHCDDVGIQLSAYYIIGFPGEKVEQIQRTLDYALTLYRKYAVFPYVNYAIPLRGTELYKEVVEKEYLTHDVTPENLLDATHFRGTGLIKTDDFTPEQLREMMLRFNRQLMVGIIVKMLTDPRILRRYVKIAARYPYVLKRHLPRVGEFWW